MVSPTNGLPVMPPGHIPTHVGIILDGNGRWAQQRGLLRRFGHSAGVPPIVDTIDGALQIGISHLSLYVFSTENWRRETSEVTTILEVIGNFLTDHGTWMRRKGVRLRWSGRHEVLPLWLADSLAHWSERTRAGTSLNLTICADYGSREELRQAAARLAQDAVAGRVDPTAITEGHLAGFLYQPDLPDLDLIIRTSGEQRLSNFMLWQGAYAELVFVDTLWPDFTRHDLWAAVETYAHRQRWFGGQPVA